MFLVIAFIIRTDNQFSKAQCYFNLKKSKKPEKNHSDKRKKNFSISVPPWSFIESASFSVGATRFGFCATTWLDAGVDSHITALLFSAPVDPRRGFEDDEAEMERWTPRWLPSFPTTAPPTLVRPVFAETCDGEWLAVPLLPVVADPPALLVEVTPPPPPLEGSTVRRDSEDPERLPSLSTWWTEKNTFKLWRLNYLKIDCFQEWVLTLKNVFFLS